MIIINKATQKQTIAAIKSGDFSEVDKIEESAKKDARKVFNAVSSDVIPLLFFCCLVSSPGGVGSWPVQGFYCNAFYLPFNGF